MGSPPFADKALAALINAGHNVVAVVSAPPSRRGRGRQSSANSVIALATQYNLPVLQPISAKSSEFKAEFAALKCDLAVVVSYGQILDAEFLELPKLACVNVHASLLPRWRGASPIQSAIKSGDLVSGVCIQKMVLALDAGEVLATREISLNNESTGPWLFQQCAEQGAELITEFVNQVSRTKQLPPGRPQDEALVTHCGKVKKQDGKINWQQPATDVYRQLRANYGWPGSFCILPSKDNLIVHAAKLVLSDSIAGEPGQIIIGDNSEVFVCCESGAIELIDVQRSGKAKLTAKQFMNGNSIKSGEKLN
ncbi:MAG: methionyl-tRNA formyltransferase [Planctomycetes bacterium]|nr:methionyl-tRNA formyltransferase [Planctomycetota bacterium]